MTQPKTKPKTKSTKNNTNTPRYADAIAIEILNKYKDPVTSTTILPDDYILPSSSYVDCFVGARYLVDWYSLDS